jgi:CBS domain-containing protein
MSIAEFSTKSVITALEGETVFNAAKNMMDRGVGSIVVVDLDKKPIGMVTDRDIALKAVVQGKDPKRTILKEIMTKDIIILSQDRGFFETTKIMSDMGIRRIPIVDHEGKLTGIISLDDLIMVFGEELTNIANAIACGTSTPKERVKTSVRWGVGDANPI